MTILLALFAWIFGHASHPNLPEPHEESVSYTHLTLPTIYSV